MADNFTPKSKIAKLKREIEQLDHKVLECTTDRPAYQARFGPAQDLKTERPMGEKRRDSTLDARQIDTLRDRVAVIQVHRQAELSAYQQRKAKLAGTIKSGKVSLATLQTQLTEARKRLEAEQTKAEMQQRMKAAKRKRDAQLQEKEKGQLITRHDSVQGHIAEAESRFAVCDECRKMCWEEVCSWMSLHEECVAEREEVEEMLADFQHNYPQQEVSSLVESLWTVLSNKQTEAKRTALLARLDALEARLTAETKGCFLVSSERQMLLERLTEFSDPRTDRDIHSVERRLLEEWGDEDGLDRAVVTLNATAGFDIDEQILKTQVEVVEQRLSALEKKQTLDTLDLSERILEAQEEPDPRHSSEPHHSDSKEARLRRQAEDLKRTQVNRIAAVSQWRKEAMGLLKTKELTANSPVADEVVMDEIRARLRTHPMKSLLDRLLQEYVNSLQSREAHFQSQEFTEIHNRLAAVSQDLNQHNARKTALQLERVRARSELKELTINTRKLSKPQANIRHTHYSTASALVSRAVFWDTLAGEAANRLKALLATYREAEAKVEEEQRAKDALGKELTQTRSQLRESHAKLEMLFSTQAAEPIEKQELESRAAVLDIQDKLTQTKRQLETMEAELALLDSEWTQRAEALTREEADIHEELQSVVVAQQIGIQSSRVNLDSFDETNRGEVRTNQRRGTVVGEISHEDGKLTNMRSSSELQGTRSRSLLRTSVQRLPSRSPINSREHEDLMDLLDLDDDLDLLLETQYEEPPTRNLPEGLSPADRDFFERIMPLIDGTELFKKYSQMNSLKQRAFDPLVVTDVPPEACGFGLRTFRLTRDLREVEIKQGLKSMVESTIPLAQIQAPLIPQSTMSILKTQKKLLRRKPQARVFVENLNKRYREMKESGFVNPNSAVYEEKCRDCTMYPFSLVLTQSGRVEVVARSYYTFKTWVNGLNVLIKRRDELPDLCSRLRANRRWV